MKILVKLKNMTDDDYNLKNKSEYSLFWRIWSW